MLLFLAIINVKPLYVLYGLHTIVMFHVAVSSAFLSLFAAETTATAVTV